MTYRLINEDAENETAQERKCDFNYFKHFALSCERAKQEIELYMNKTFFILVQITYSVKT